MQIINPVEITSSDIFSNSLTDIPYQEYSSITTYIKGQFAFWGDIVYISLQNGNLNKEPGAPGSETWWQEYSATNQLKAFDGIINSKAVQAGASQFSIKIDFADPIGGLAVLGLEKCNSYELFLFQLPSNNLVWWSGQTSLETSTSGVYRTSFVRTDIPVLSNVRLQINLIRNVLVDVTMSVGEIIAGPLIEIGYNSQYGASSGIIDYSTKEVDEFGNFEILERAYSKKSDLNVKIDPERLDYTLETLTDLRSIPVVWIITDNIEHSDIFILYGFYKDFTITIPNCTLCNLKLSIEGLV